MIKERASTDSGVGDTQRDALLAALDVHLLARTHVLVGKFTSGLFRAAYALAVGRRGALLPFVSLDAPWCSDHGVRAGFNDAFPARKRIRRAKEPILPFMMDENESAIPSINLLSNMFLC